MSTCVAGVSLVAGPAFLFVLHFRGASAQGEAGFIEQDGACTECLVGLACPTGSTVELLLSNQSGTTSVPRVLPSYYSNPLVPLATYRCRANCPGGLPGTCDAGLVGLPCGECPEGFYFSSGVCTDCGVAVPAGWVLALALILLAIFTSYYLMTSPYTGKATVLTCTTASMGMMVSMFQNLGVLQTVSVPWPAELSDFLSFFQLFTLNLDSFGFSCLAGGPVQRYVSNCAFFVFVILALISMYFLTKLLAKLLPWPRVKALAWHPYKSMSTVGQFCQVSFTTMSNVGLMPFMCYSHPMGASSVLKYSEVFCGSEEHGTMQFFGILLLCLSMLFVACCFFAAWKAPAWSGLPIQAGIRFLVFRFGPRSGGSASPCWCAALSCPCRPSSSRTCPRSSSPAWWPSSCCPPWRRPGSCPGRPPS